MLLAVRQIPVSHVGPYVKRAIDDSPTKRYGPKVELAGIHHNPTSGLPGSEWLHGHVWVTTSWLVSHPLWGCIGLPLRALISARQKDLQVLQNVGRAPWSFRTKLEPAVEPVEWCAIFFQNCFHRPVMAIADGAYAKRPFLSRVKKTGVHRGQPPVEGRRTVRSSPAFRKTPKRTTAYLREQQTVPKSTGQSPLWLDADPHEAVWPRANRSLQDIPGHVSPGWRSDPRDDCEATLEAVADRSAIEQNFHDVKAVYGSGQQQVRNVWCNVACWNLCLWLHTLVELWSWRRSSTPLKQRGERPWDEPARRPCHADRFKTLRKHVLRESFSRLPRLQRSKRKIQSLFKALTRLAT